METTHSPAEQDYLAAEAVTRPVIKLSIPKRIGRNLMHLVGIQPKSPYAKNVSWDIEANSNVNPA